MATRKKQTSEAAVREIRRKTRRRFAPEEKIRIVLDGLRVRVIFGLGHSKRHDGQPERKVLVDLDRVDAVRESANPEGNDSNVPLLGNLADFRVYLRA